MAAALAGIAPLAKAGGQGVRELRFGAFPAGGGRRLLAGEDDAAGAVVQRLFPRRRSGIAAAGR